MLLDNHSVIWEYSEVILYMRSHPLLYNKDTTLYAIMKRFIIMIQSLNKQHMLHNLINCDFDKDWLAIKHMLYFCTQLFYKIHYWKNRENIIIICILHP